MFSDNLVSIIIFVAVVLISMSLRIVKEYDRGVIFFLGKVTGVRGPGLIILIPILEQMTKVNPPHDHHEHPIAEDHHKGQRVNRHRSRRLLQDC